MSTSSPEIKVGRLTLAEYPEWQILARLSREEQGRPALNYAEEPYHADRLIWVSRLGYLIGYIHMQDTAILLNCPIYLVHPGYPKPRYMISDLYVVREQRGERNPGQRIANLLIGHALNDLTIGRTEPIALLMPVREVALTTLKQSLGNRATVGFKQFGTPIFGSIEEIMQASKKYGPRRMEE